MLGKRDRIQELKKLNLVDSQNINIINVVAIFLYDEKIKAFLKSVVYMLSEIRFDQLELKGSDSLCFYGCKSKKREDYDEMVSFFRSKCKVKTDYIEVVESYGFLNLWANISAVKKVYGFLKDGHLGFLERMSISMFYARIYRIEDVYLDFISQYKKVVTFCDAHPIENYITQLANHKCIKTYTLQHGQYCVVSDQDNPDSESVLNFMSDVLFCWGPVTKREFIRNGFSSDRIYLSGRMKKENASSLINVDTKKMKFGVLLSGENNRSVNFKLIEIANDISASKGMPYEIRLHPANSISDYRMFLDEGLGEVHNGSLEDFFESKSFSISYATGAFINSLQSLCPCYIYKDKNLPKAFHLIELNFSSAKDFELRKLYNCKDILNKFISPIPKVIELG